jgi:uncharacterized protein (TIGR03437 family)
MRSTSLSLLAAAFCASLAFAQKPVVFPGGVVNGASFVAAGTTGGAVAPGSIVSIFGTNLAPAEAAAQKTPLPDALNGVSVTFNGVPAPLFFVAPGQINAQVPIAIPAPLVVPVVVTTAAGVSAPVSVDVRWDSLGLFMVDSSACGRGAVYNVASDGSLSLNSPTNSAEPDGLVTVWGTGLGSLSSFPPDGVPSPGNPPLVSNEQRGDYEYDLPGGVQWAGRAPLQVGVDQYNIWLRPEIEGCSVPLRIAGADAFSQPVPVSIHTGGGACVDPPATSFGLLTWTRSVSYGATTTLTETFTADFPQAVNLTLPEFPSLTEGQWTSPLPPSGPPSCAWTEPAYLNAGTLTIQAPNLTSDVPRSAAGRYSLSLPQGTIGPGRFAVTASGAAGAVGAFQTVIQVPPPIRLTVTSGPAGVGPNWVQADWTGGDANCIVEVEMRTTTPIGQHEWVVAAGSAGTVLLGSKAECTGEGLGVNCSSESLVGDDLVVRQVAPAPQTFTIPGTTLGGRYVWSYEFHYPVVH